MAGKLLKSLLPRLQKALTTDAAVCRFISALATAFGLASEPQDGGILILAPGQDMPVAATEDAATMPETLTAAPGFADSACAEVL